MEEEYFIFDSTLIFQVEGRDSTRYLQARLSNDIKKLQVNSVLLAAALTAQGKIEGLFRVYKKSETEYLLISDGGDPETQKKALSRFIVADRVTITDITNSWSLIYATEAQEIKNLPAEIIYPSKRASLNGADILIQKDKAPNLNSIGKEIDKELFHIKRVRLGIPQFGEEFNDNMLFSEYLIEDAVSFHKGCYVGQEVIEKIDSRGEAPRILIPCSSNTEGIKKGDKVLNSSDEKIGEVISWYDSGGDHAGFIRVRNEPPFSDLRTESNIKLVNL